jgi:hypothetical protein
LIPDRYSDITANSRQDEERSYRLANSAGTSHTRSQNFWLQFILNNKLKLLNLNEMHMYRSKLKKMILLLEDGSGT